MIIANQKSVRRSERKLANKIMINGKVFSNFTPFKENAGTLEIIKIEGIIRIKLYKIFVYKEISIESKI